MPSQPMDKDAAARIQSANVSSPCRQFAFAPSADLTSSPGQERRRHVLRRVSRSRSGRSRPQCLPVEHLRQRWFQPQQRRREFRQQEIGDETVQDLSLDHFTTKQWPAASYLRLRSRTQLIISTGRGLAVCHFVSSTSTRCK